MILQSNADARVYGEASPEENIQVSFAGHLARTRADKNGHWTARLGKLKPGSSGQLTIRGSNVLTLKNVVAGEIWLCAGQSNISFPVKECSSAKEITARGTNAQIRFFVVPEDMANKPRSDVRGSWQVCDRKSLPAFSAIGAMFAMELHDKLHSPVGVIECAYGGSSIKTWTSADVVKSDKSIAKALFVPANSPIRFMQYAIEKEEKEHILTPNKPHALAQSFRQPLVPCTLFNAMIAPLTGYAIKGITWYQGEADAEEATLYARLFPAMIIDWRQKWGQPKLPFLFVQLPRFEMTSNCIPTKGAWAKLRDAQTQALKLPDTSMIVTIDQGEADQLHPKKKDVVAHRLVLATLERAYGGPHFGGPALERVTMKNDKILCQFSNSSGLHASGGPEVKGFEICGKDRIYRPVQARIESGLVVLKIRGPRPLGVRYAWANYPVVNLYNDQELPAAPFCTDIPKNRRARSAHFT